MTGPPSTSCAWPIALHPRGFNFLERHGDDDAQLVASEFVQLLADLWPRFCGPKMQHYLRHALFAAFADPHQQTILELIRILTNDRARERYTKQLADPWSWPSGATSGRAPASGSATLRSRRCSTSSAPSSPTARSASIVGQGDSTISPRMVMDAGDVLVVDLSGVGGDNAALFGAMLISRFAIDAVGRQGRPASERRPHLLVVDEAQRFHTQAMEGILAEGRKFGLHIALAAQSMSALGDRLAGAVRTNVASVALLEPGTDDVRDLGRLFAPVSAGGATGDAPVRRRRADSRLRRHATRSRRPGFDARAGRSRAPGRHRRRERRARRPTVAWTQSRTRSSIAPAETSQRRKRSRPRAMRLADFDPNRPTGDQSSQGDP